jgi:glucose uptake protein
VYHLSAHEPQRIKGLVLGGRCHAVVRRQIADELLHFALAGVNSSRHFIWNSLMMVKPLTGAPVPFRDSFSKGSPRLHLVGILGGMIWNLGMAFSIIASTKAGAALSYGLGQGATMIGAFWGVFIWKEFKGAPPGTNKYLAAMFLFYLLGLGVLIASKF